MLKKYNCKIIPTFSLMSKYIKHDYLLKVQLHKNLKRRVAFTEETGPVGWLMFHRLYYFSMCVE